MRPPGDAAAACILGAQLRHASEELRKEPEAEINYRRYFNQADDEEYRQNCLNASAREEHQISSQNAGNGTTGADCRNAAFRRHECLAQSGSDTAQEVKNDVLEVPDPVFDIITEDIQGPHV